MLFDAWKPNYDNYESCDRLRHIDLHVYMMNI